MYGTVHAHMCIDVSKTIYISLLLFAVITIPKTQWYTTVSYRSHLTRDVLFQWPNLFINVCVSMFQCFNWIQKATCGFQCPHNCINSYTWMYYNVEVEYIFLSWIYRVMTYQHTLVILDDSEFSYYWEKLSSRQTSFLLFTLDWRMISIGNTFIKWPSKLYLLAIIILSIPTAIFPTPTYMSNDQ